MKHVLKRMKEIVDEKASIVYEEREYDADTILERSCLLVREINRAMKKTNNLNVAIYLEHDMNVFFSMIASLSLGTSYILIDSSLPEERRDYILQDSETDVVITWHEKKDCFPGKIVIDVDEVVLNAGRKMIETNLTSYENSIAYICYTSGTTGKPKGVMVTYEGLDNFTKAMKQIVNFNSELRIACLTTSSFDIFFVESILPVIYGMKVYIASIKQANNPRKLKKFLLENRVDIVQMTPSRVQMLLYESGNEEVLKNIKTFLIGGEQFSSNIFDELRAKNKDAEIFNLYGPTETTIWSSFKELSNSADITIGRPLLNNEIIIYDNEGIREQGEKGEILIGGKGLALGYKNNNILTEEKFITIEEKRYFRTGDLGYVSENGDICCLGRLDNQVKINGYRVELEEIESVLKSCQKIQNAIVYYIKNNNGLVALYTSEELISDKEMKEYLSNVLPQYMIPKKYIRCEDFIYGHNGKISRKENRIYLTEHEKVKTSERKKYGD